MAMPWTLAKEKRQRYLSGELDVKELNALFDACFRIQREAIEAAGHHIPLIVENVRGAQEWVGRSRWSYGSFHLWGDVPALMPMTMKVAKVPGFRFDGSGKSFQSASVEHTGVKAPGMDWSNPEKRGQDFTRLAGKHADAGVKGSVGYERDHHSAFGWKKPGTNSKSKARKRASAMIAKIPLPLSRHIARVYYPNR